MININTNSKTPATPAGTAHGFTPRVEDHGGDFRVTVTHREPMMWSDGMFTKLVHNKIWGSKAEAEAFVDHCLSPAGRFDERRGVFFPALDLRFWREGFAGGEVATAADREVVARRVAAYNDRRNRD